MVTLQLSLFFGLLPIYLVASISISTQLLHKEGVVHCYCNLPECITSNYMCKSGRLACYSELGALMQLDKARYGCLDDLPRERQEECGNVPGVPPIHQPSLLVCCYRDMCNHVDSPQTRRKYKETLLGVYNGVGESVKTEERLDYKRDEVWFKIATVAVPVCGALILLILVLLAVKIIRNETLDDTLFPPKFRRRNGGEEKKEIGLVYKHNDTRVKLSSEKNLANAKLNSLPVFIDFEKISHPSECNIYKGPSSPLLSYHLPHNLSPT